ncbi:MAG: hypothetical protein WDN48_11315 [Pseudolabrys sp.]
MGEARQHLLGRAEDIREYDRRMNEMTMERDALQSRINELEAERIQRESEYKEIDQARVTMTERSATLARAYTMKEAALARAEEANGALNERLATLEATLANEKQSAENTIEELNAAVKREKMERSVIEGALETGRRDFARLMREVMALQRTQQAAEIHDDPRAANAA